MAATFQEQSSVTSTPVLITYRLHGSLTQNASERLEAKKNAKLERLSEKAREVVSRQEVRAINKERCAILTAHEVAVDKALHRRRGGPFYLRNEPVRDIVLKAWKNQHDRGLIHLIAVCVMSNHVHVLLKAPEDVSSMSVVPLMESHRNFTAHKASHVLDEPPADLWEDAFHNRRVHPRELSGIVQFVLNNPVEAGLVEDWARWPGTFLNEDYAALLPEQ